MCYNDNDLSTLYCCLHCCFALLFLLLSLAYSRLCYPGVLLYSFLRVVLLVLVVAIVVGCVPSTSSSFSSSVDRRHPLAPSYCNHGVLLFRLCRVVSHCFAKLWYGSACKTKKNIEFYLKNRTLYSYFLDAFSAFIQFAGTL